MFIASISGPSMMCSGFSYSPLVRASSVSRTQNSSMPCRR